MPNNNLKLVVLLSLLIMVYQGVFDSNAGIISQLTHQHNNDWIGPVSSAIFYFGCSISSNFLPHIPKHRTKYTFFIGSLGYLLFTGSSLLFIKFGFPIWIQIFILLISFISGILCSIFLNTQFNYINMLASCQEDNIKYFGINLAITLSSNIFGNLFSMALIIPLGQFYTMLAITGVILVCGFCFLGFDNPRGQGNIQKDRVGEQQEKQSNGQSLLTEKLHIDDHEQKQDNPQQNTINSSQQITQQHSHLPKHSPFHVCTSFGISGVNLAFVYCMLAILIYQAFEQQMSDLQLNHLTFIIFLFEGVGELLGGLILMFVSKKIKDTILADIIITIILVISVSITILGYYSKNIYIITIGSIFTGISDCQCAVLGLTIASYWKEKGISVFLVVQNLFGGITIIVAIFTPLAVSIGWMYCYCIFNAVLLMLYRKKQKKQKDQIEVVNSTQINNRI